MGRRRTERLQTGSTNRGFVRDSVYYAPAPLPSAGMLASVALKQLTVSRERPSQSLHGSRHAKQIASRGPDSVYLPRPMTSYDERVVASADLDAATEHRALASETGGGFGRTLHPEAAASPSPFAHFYFPVVKTSAHAHGARVEPGARIR